MLKRTHTCDQLRTSDVGKEAIVSGWVNSARDHGNLVFVDVRDRYGITQVVFNPEDDAELHAKARDLKNEYVIAVKGMVCKRPEGTVNPDLATGEIEIMAKEMEVLSRAEVLPLEVSEDAQVGANLRLTYRFIDLRRRPMQHALMFRHKVFQTIRRYFDDLGFVEVETPFLTRSTPEGARDFLVPSRLNPGTFFALPQSPQLFKQILMVAGLDKYFQIVKCFRDEDLRADRQPEFTQLDMEMSFVDEEDVMRVIEGMMATVFREGLGLEIDVPFPRFSYDEAMARFGTDKPDIRFGMELSDVGEIVTRSEFQVFKASLSSGGQVRGLCAPYCASFTRKEIDELTAFVGDFGAKGLAWLKVEGNSLTSPIAKFFSEDVQRELLAAMGAKDGDLLLFVADKRDIVNHALSELRLHLGRRLALRDDKTFKHCWVTEFPLVEYNEEEKRYDPLHHPFTSPQPQDLPRLEGEPLNVRARAYDIVLNGVEIGGGSIRIHDPEVQKRVFRLIEIDDESARRKFGFLLDALKYGAPPHGGIALGLDRVVMIMLGLSSIRDVIAFPKTQKGACLMTHAPTTVEEAQLKELGIRLA